MEMTLTETQWLKVIHSYVSQTIDPIYILESEDDIDGLEVEDIPLIPQNLFKKEKYDKEYVITLLSALSEIIIKREEEDLKEQNACL
jgi:hypothetical protein